MDEKTKRTVLLLVAIGLVVLAGVQAMQINEISKSVDGVKYADPSGSGAGNQQKPAPQMVGGC